MPELVKILDPQDYNRATWPLKDATDKLYEASKNFKTTQNQAHSYISSFNSANTADPLTEVALEQSLFKTYSVKGPTQNAIDKLGYWFTRAVVTGHRLDDAQVREKFLDWLMALVTSGFSDKDTTGTQIGNFKGVWTGGGFNK